MKAPPWCPPVLCREQKQNQIRAPQLTCHFPHPELGPYVSPPLYSLLPHLLPAPQLSNWLSSKFILAFTSCVVKCHFLLVTLHLKTCATKTSSKPVSPGTFPTLRLVKMNPSYSHLHIQNTFCTFYETNYSCKENCKSLSVHYSM